MLNNLKTCGLMNYTKEQISEIISKHAEQVRIFLMV